MKILLLATIIYFILKETVVLFAKSKKFKLLFIKLFPHVPQPRDKVVSKELFKLPPADCEWG